MQKAKGKDAIAVPNGVIATRGRPASLSDGKRVNVYLDAASLERAAKLGDGNVSEGIRRSLMLPPT